MEIPRARVSGDGGEVLSMAVAVTRSDGMRSECRSSRLYRAAWVEMFTAATTQPGGVADRGGDRPQACLEFLVENADTVRATASRASARSGP